MINYTELVQLVEFSCRVQNVKMPYVYFIEHTKNGIILRDNNFNFVSNDKRDFDATVYYVKFVRRENVLYININNLKDNLIARALILRQTRAIYQSKQISLHINNKKTEEKDYVINQWIYCLESDKRKNIYCKDSVIEIDRNAYSNLIMKILYSIQYEYDISEKEEYDNRYNKLYKKYKANSIIDIANKMKLPIKAIKK